MDHFELLKELLILDEELDEAITKLTSAERVAHKKASLTRKKRAALARAKYWKRQAGYSKASPKERAALNLGFWTLYTRSITRKYNIPRDSDERGNPKY